MIDDPRARELLHRASYLTADELVALGTATNHAMGRWLPPRRDWLEALRSADAAAVTDGRSDGLGDEAGNATMDAIFVAVCRIAEARGRDPQELRAALETWRRGLDRGHKKRHRRDFQHVRQVLSRAAGRRVSSRVGPAMMGTDAAVLASASYDLGACERSLHTSRTRTPPRSLAYGHRRVAMTTSPPAFSSAVAISRVPIRAPSPP